MKANLIFSRISIRQDKQDENLTDKAIGHSVFYYWLSKTKIFFLF